MAQAPVLNFTQIASGLSSPVDAVSANDGSNRLFIVEQGGKVKIIRNGSILPTPFFNLAPRIAAGGEQGLLSIAFHPGYADNLYFFVYYNNLRGDITVARMRTKDNNPDEADTASLTVLISIPKLYGNHNGGRLLFYPDGNLYFATGDGGGSGDPNNNAQNGNSLLGKMLRINVDNFDTVPYYTIPADNPFVNDNNVKNEIFSLGLRNPFRWSFDKLNGDVWIGDVGQSGWEEIDRLPLADAKGANYGWRCYEGRAAGIITGCGSINSYIQPVFDYGHNSITGGSSVIGGYVYRGSKYPALYGWYICADFYSRNAWLLYPFGNGKYLSFIQPAVPAFIAAFAQDENNELYAVAIDGKLYSISTNDTIITPLLASFEAKPYLGFNEITWQYTNSSSIFLALVEYSLDGIEFIPAGSVANDGSARQHFAHKVTSQPVIFYRLKIATTDNRALYSHIIKVAAGNTTAIKVYPSIIAGSQLMLESTTPVQALCIFSIDGKKMFEKPMGNFLGNTSITLPALGRGMYVVQLFLKDGSTKVEKIFVQR